MCGQGDRELVHNWRSTYTINQLKQIAVEGGYSCFTVSNGQPSFPFAAMKKFDFQVTPETCKPITSCCHHPCKIYILHKKGQKAAEADIGYLNNDLNGTARNTDDVDRIRKLVSQGADLLSTNGEPWNHTPLHQACYHNRPKVVEVLLSLLKQKGLLKECLNKHSNPCGRGDTGIPLELARGGGHSDCVALLEKASNAGNTHFVKKTQEIELNFAEDLPPEAFVKFRLRETKSSQDSDIDISIRHTDPQVFCVMLFKDGKTVYNSAKRVDYVGKRSRESKYDFKLDLADFHLEKGEYTMLIHPLWDHNTSDNDRELTVRFSGSQIQDVDGLDHDTGKKLL